MSKHKSDIIAKEFADKIKAEQTREKIVQIAPIIVLIAIFLSMSSLIGGVFVSLSNIQTILGQMAIPLLIAIGLTFVIMLGSIDLSIDGTVGMAGAIISLLVLNNKNTNNLGLWGVLITIAICLVIGFLIGFIHTRFKIPSFMVSFSFMYICMGIGMLSYKAQPSTIEDPFFTSLTTATIFGIPTITIVAFVILLLAYILQEYTVVGRYVYAIGASENMPRIAGIKVDKVKILVFMFASICFALAGIIGAIRLGQGQVQIGTGMMFPAQSAVIVGGTPLSGGKGGVVNTLVGVCIITVLENGLIHLGVNPYWRMGLQGFIILVAVILATNHFKKEIVK